MSKFFFDLSFIVFKKAGECSFMSEKASHQHLCDVSRFMLFNVLRLSG